MINGENTRSKFVNGRVLVSGTGRLKEFMMKFEVNLLTEEFMTNASIALNFIYLRQITIYIYTVREMHKYSKSSVVIERQLNIALLFFSSIKNLIKVFRF